MKDRARVRERGYADDMNDGTAFTPTGVSGHGGESNAEAADRLRQGGVAARGPRPRLPGGMRRATSGEKGDLGISGLPQAADRAGFEEAARRFERLEVPTGSGSGARDRSVGIPLDTALMAAWSAYFGVELPQVLVHQDEDAQQYVQENDAAALTVGDHIYLDPADATPEVLLHELTHIAQRHAPGGGGNVATAEQEAQETTNGAAGPLTRAPEVPLAHPALRALLRSGRWLMRRTTRTVSKHIARHGRRMADRSVHTVFRNPRHIRELLQKTVSEATAIARRTTRHGGDDVIEEGGFKIFRQASGAPGKYRTVVERELPDAIGKQGEHILRVVIDESGRVVTAFPTDKLLTLGGAVAVGAMTARSAEASERIQSRIEAEEQQGTGWLGGLLDLLNPFSADALNEGEGLELDIEHIVDQSALDVIADVEASEQTCLSDEQREEIRVMVRAGLGLSMSLGDEEPEE